MGAFAKKKVISVEIRVFLHFCRRSFLDQRAYSARITRRLFCQNFLQKHYLFGHSWFNIMHINSFTIIYTTSSGRDEQGSAAAVPLPPPPHRPVLRPAQPLPGPLPERRHLPVHPLGQRRGRRHLVPLPALLRGRPLPAPPRPLRLSRTLLRREQRRREGRQLRRQDNPDSIG